MMIRSPISNHRKNSVTHSLTSLLDIVPTLLDWFNIPYMDQSSFDTNEAPPLTGKSLLPLLVQGKFDPSSVSRHALTLLRSTHVYFQNPQKITQLFLPARHIMKLLCITPCVLLELKDSSSYIILTIKCHSLLIKTFMSHQPFR